MPSSKLIRWSGLVSMLGGIAFGIACAPEEKPEGELASADTSAVAYPPGYGPNAALPEPFDERGFKFPRVIGWPEGRTPIAAEGFATTTYADGLESPRWLYILPNGDVLVAQSSYTSENLPKDLPAAEPVLRAAGMLGESPDKIALLRDADGDGSPEVRETFLSGLRQPFGMLLLGDQFYVASTDALWRYPYRAGQTRITAPGEKILDLPAQYYNLHWTRNVIARADGSKLYITVGSATAVDEEGTDTKDPRRAAILEVNPDGTGMRVFASGLQNPVGMDWARGTNVLWTVVNERDHLGEDLPPDYLTSVREATFYGWPYAYFGQNQDPNKEGERPDLVARAVKPDYALGAHTASLGLVFYTATAFPEPYRSGAFVSQRGSMLRSRFAGYRVIFVPFKNGRPSGPPREFLTGFIADEENNEVYGRPVGLAVLPDGSLLVADEAGDKIWRVSPR